MPEPYPAVRGSDSSLEAKSAFWDERILAWEMRRYSMLARFNPFAWTVRRRMRTAQALVRGEFAGHADILDLGCGSGLLANAVVDAPSRRYLGIDFSRVAVAAARTRFARHADRIRFEQRDVLESPGRKASLIVALGLLDWLETGEVARWFGGLDARSLCFSFTEADGGGAGFLYRQYRRVSDKIYRARSFRQEEIVTAARSAGYRVDQIIVLSRLDPGRLVLAARL